jgi:hypothetical protein
LANIHVPDFLILPFGRATKDDLGRITLAAVSADGLYFNSDVSCVFIQKSAKTPMSLGRFNEVFGEIVDPNDELKDDSTLLFHMRDEIKFHNPNMTKYEVMFIDLYFEILAAGERASGNHSVLAQLSDLVGSRNVMDFALRTPDQVWRALLPIPEMQLYVRDPLASEITYHPENNFRVDYGFWDGKQLIAVEIDGAEPEGYARDVRRDRLLRRAGVDVIHILNLELQRHKGRALIELLPPRFFGFDWDYEGRRPNTSPF